MKKLLESAFMQNLIAILVVSYLRFVNATTRWQRIDQEAVEALWAAKGPVILTFWHERLHLSHASWPHDGRAQKVSVLASNSKSGEVSMKINTRFGYHSIRGSSAKKTDPAKQKGGAQAFRDMLRWLKSGGCMAMTPDGPRGPRREMTAGTLKLSQLTGAPLLLMGQSVSNFVTLRTWDKMRVPLPFGRGVIVWEVFPPVPYATDEAALEALCDEVGARITVLTDRADAMVGAKS